MSTKKITQTLDKLEKSLSKSKTHSTNAQLLSSVLKTLIAEKDVHLSETFERNLVDAFTIQIGPLYDLKPAEALNVAAAVMNYLFERKVRAQLSEGQKVGTEEVFISEILRWQRVIDRGILSGILNHFGSSGANKDLIGICTYPALLNILKSEVWASLDYALKNQVLGLLVDTSQGCPKNKSILTNRNILSASDLARLITLTYEYVVMDPLMELMARLLPSLNHNKERGDFIHKIFRNEIMEKAFGESAAVGLGRLFNSVRGDDIFETTFKSIRLMGERDQRRPQAFGAKNITANGVLFVQPLPYYVLVDKIGFVANVGSEEEGVETLMVTFETIQAIHFIRDSQDGLRILITLFSPPLLQYRPMDKPFQSPNRETLGSSLLFDMEPDENVALRLTLAAHGMQSKIFDSSTPASAKKHPRASQTAAPIDLISPVDADMIVSGNASIRAKEREMAKALSSPIEEYSENDHSFRGITKFDPFPLVAESPPATAEKSSKRPLKSSSQKLGPTTSLKDVFGNDSDSDLSDPPSMSEYVRESSFNLEGRLSPPSSPSPASQTGAPPINWKPVESLSRTSASAKASTRSTRKRSAGVEKVQTIVKKPRTKSPNNSSAASTRSKLPGFSHHPSSSARKTYKGSHKKSGRLPTPPVLCEKPSIDFDIIPNSEAQPKLPKVQHSNSSGRLSITSETGIFPSDNDLVLEPVPVPKKKGRASRIIDEDPGDGMPEPDCWKALDAKVTFVEKPSSVTQPGEGASGSETSVVKQSPVVGRSTLKDEMTPSVHAHIKGVTNNGIHTNPLKTPQKKKHRKAPWEQPNFLPSDSLDDVKFQPLSGPDTAAQSNLVAHADEDHSKAYGGAPASDPVDFDEALKTSTPAKYRRPVMPESPAPIRIGSQQGLSMSHVSRSAKYSVGFDTDEQCKNHPGSKRLPTAKENARSASIGGGEPLRDKDAKERFGERSMDGAFGPLAETKNGRDKRSSPPKLASIDAKAKEAANQIIDLTSDLEMPSAGQPHERRSLLDGATTPTPVKSAFKTQAGTRPRHSVSFAASTTLHSPMRPPTPEAIPLGSKAQLRLGKEHLPALTPNASKTAAAKKNSAGLPDKDKNWVSDILNQICDRLVETKRRKFQGIRQSVLAARNEILQEVQNDLRHCLAVSIEHYNGFLELNSQYEAAERTIQDAYAELNHVNAAISEKLEEVIKDHDRLSICKGMTTTLKRTGSRKAIGPTFEKLGVYLDTD